MNRSLSRREQAQAYCEAGNQRLAQHDFPAAKAEFEQATALLPQQADAHLGLAQAFRNLNKWPEAERSARSALEADPQHAAATHYLGALLAEQDRLSEALPFLQAAADRAPDVAQHHRDLGVALLFLGDVAAGRERLLKTLELDVHSNEVLYTLVRTSRMNDGSAQARWLLDAASDLADRAADLPPLEQAQVLFALAKAHEDLGDIDASARAYERANAVKRSMFEYDVGEVESRFRRTAEVFNAALLDKLAGAGAPSNRPIFIVGMPRSGSTLVEQMLSAHPEVHGAGEIDVLGPLVENSRGLGGSRYPDWGVSMNQMDCSTIGQAYLSSLPSRLNGHSRTTDKWLPNFEHLGLISICLPNAKIIHCQRDQRDQLFSCWSLLFSERHEYAYDIGELGRFFRAYQDLMAHWRSALPRGQMLEVRYERLVADPEAELRRILQHCDLEWDEQTLRFWEATRPVKTSSMVQVRQPLYEHSIGRWRPFAERLRTLFKPLGLDAKT
ncbi:MAG: sulfotransferase [Caulobacterales bacterium]